MGKCIDVDQLRMKPDTTGNVMNGVLVVGAGRATGKTVCLVQAALKQMIENAPAADVAPVIRAEWEIRKVPGQVDTYGRPCELAACSHCGFTWTDLYSVKNYFKHCPGCGADMVKREVCTDG